MFSLFLFFFLLLLLLILFFFFFFFNDTATTEIYTLSLHDALPIYLIYTNIKLAYNGLLSATNRTITLKLRRTNNTAGDVSNSTTTFVTQIVSLVGLTDRKSTRLNSSHGYISYAVFCLKKKKKKKNR